MGKKLLAIIPAIFLIALCNVFIAFTTSGVVLIQLLAIGINKHVSLVAAILTAIGIHAYIVWNHKIRDYIKQGAKNE
jgi:uncharacterized membrane protein